MINLNFLLLDYSLRDSQPYQRSNKDKLRDWNIIHVQQICSQSR